MQPTKNTTLSPKAYRCLKQEHRRRIEDTPLPFLTQTRLNACQLQVCMIYSVQQQTQCTTHAHSTSCRSRPAGLVTSFTRSFGLARLDLNCWRCALIEHDITRGTAFFSPRISTMVLFFVQGSRFMNGFKEISKESRMGQTCQTHSDQGRPSKKTKKKQEGAACHLRMFTHTQKNLRQTLPTTSR